VEEIAKAALHPQARFAIGTELQMTAEILSLCVSHGTIEEKVDSSFDIATDHRVPS
jgi:hypothetical protein